MTEHVWINNEGGKWHVEGLRSILRSLPIGHYLVTIADGAAKRSTPQNSLLHVRMRMYAKELNAMQATGPKIHRWTMEDVKEMMLAKFAPMKSMADPNGEVHEVRKRSHELDMREAGEFLDEVEAYMATTFGIVLREGQQQIELT